MNNTLTTSVDLLKSEVLVNYDHALQFMQNRVKSIIKGEANSLLWLLEHPHTYTAGTSSNDNDLIDKNKAPVVKTGRGGKHTYHGPGQRVAYVMLDIKKLHNDKPDLRKFINQLEQWIIDTLAAFDIKGERREGRIGIWTIDEKGNEVKLAAIGIRIEKWVSYHGVSINIKPDMSYFKGIVPCGIKGYEAGSIIDLGKDLDIKSFDDVLINAFKTTFNVSINNA